jgi:hypothetical protein
MKLFGRKREKEAEGCKKVENEELHNVHTSRIPIIAIISEAISGWDMQNAW